MKRIPTYFLLLPIAAFLLQSCARESIGTFDDANSLWFYSGDWSDVIGTSQRGSLDYSFFYTEGSPAEDIVLVDIRLTGKLSDTDLRLPLVQLNAGEPGAAVAGVHYVAFDDPRVADQIIIPAGQAAVAIPVIIKNTDDMKTAEFALELGFKPDDNFVPGLKDNAQFTINITAMAVKPAMWDEYYAGVLGTWGQAKMKFLIDEVGLLDYEMQLSYNTDLARYWGIRARAKLTEYETEHGPLYEADNTTRVTFDA